MYMTKKGVKIDTKTEKKNTALEELQGVSQLGFHTLPPTQTT